MSTALPKDINEILVSLSEPESQRIKEYIASLHAEIEKLGGTVDAADDNDGKPTEEETSTKVDIDDGFTVPQYESGSGEDYEKQSELKAKAADLKNNGSYEEALESYNEAVVAAPPSALLYANRAIVLEKLGHYKAAETDCKLALEQNPDSAKALKTRGKLRYQHLNDWEGALSDLSQAQSIDFDPDIADILKELTKKRIEKEKLEAEERIKEECALRKKAEDIKRAREEAKREEEEAAASAAQDGMPGGGMGGMPGGGMGGMPGGGMPNQNMMDAMSDPEVQAALKNPKVIAAFQEIMAAPGGPAGLLSNPGKLQKFMADPEVGPALTKIMSKMMPGMGGMGGGMPSSGNNTGDDDDGIPDLDDLPDLD